MSDIIKVRQEYFDKEHARINNLEFPDDKDRLMVAILEELNFLRDMAMRGVAT